MNGLVLEQSKNYIIGQSSRSNKLKFQLLVEKCLAACYLINFMLKKYDDQQSMFIMI